MSSSDKFISILKVQAVFGLTPFQFDKTSERFELTFLNLIQSLGSYLMISTSVIILTIMNRYAHGEENLANTANLTMFGQDTVLILAYNGAMINWFLIRGDHVDFLNKFNEMGAKLKVKLKDNLMTPTKYYQKAFCFQISVIIFCAFLIANLIVRDLYAEYFDWSIFPWNIAFGAEIATQMLTIFYIRCLAGALAQYFEVIFLKISQISNFQCKFQKETTSDLLLCINLFDELIRLKNNLSTLFGRQLLLIFLFEFVNVTLSVYFILMYSVETKFFLSSIYLFFIFAFPHIFMFIYLIHSMQKLADMVSTKKKLIKIEVII